MTRTFWKQISIVCVFLLVNQANAEPIPNTMIDDPAFLADVQASHAARLDRRVTEEQFISMSADKKTVILDARSSSRFAQMHIAGAKSLPFTEFTADTLAAAVPSKGTRILIYCNNNVANSPVAFASKLPAASLNLSTFTSLYTYGYRNVYELGPVVDPSRSKIVFEGNLVKASR